MPSLTFNIAENSKSLNISEAIYLRILQKEITQTTQDIKLLEEAIPLGDFDKVAALSHKFKGDYDNLRITQMAQLAKGMNALAKTTMDKEKTAGLFNEFISCFDQLKGVVQKSGA